MSDSERDKDIWKMRQISKRKNELFTKPCSLEDEKKVRGSNEYRILQEEFDTLFTKYGNNPLIFKDDARAGSRRDGALRIKTTIKRASKRSAKQKDSASINDLIDDENKNA
jgi:hypothetical protein